jgi:hypothetical protein
MHAHVGLIAHRGSFRRWRNTDLDRTLASVFAPGGAGHSRDGQKVLLAVRNLSRVLNGRNRRTRTTRIPRATPILIADMYTALLWRLGL